MTTWNKQTSTILAPKSVAVLSFEGQNTKSFEKVCMWTAAISFTQKILSAELVLCYSTLHLFDPQIFFNIYLLLTEFEGRTVSYGPSFFLLDLWPMREARGP